MSTPNAASMYTCTATYSNTETEDGHPVVTRGTLTISIPLREVTREEAVVVALVPGEGVFDAVPGTRLAEIRVLDGVCFRQPRTPSGGGIPPWSDWVDVLIGRRMRENHATEDEARQAILDAVSGLILIEGEMWVRISEPFLYVCRYGSRVDVMTVEIPGLEPKRRFALSQARQALAAARKEAQDHGLTPLEELDVRILIPGAFPAATEQDGLAEAPATPIIPSH